MDTQYNTPPNQAPDQQPEQPPYNQYGPIQPEGSGKKIILIFSILVLIAAGLIIFFLAEGSDPNNESISETQEEAQNKKITEVEAEVDPETGELKLKMPEEKLPVISPEFETFVKGNTGTGYENHSATIYAFVSDRQDYNFVVYEPQDWAITEATTTNYGMVAPNGTSAMGVVIHGPGTIGFQDYESCEDYVEYIGREDTFKTTVKFTKKIKMGETTLERVYYSYDANGILGEGMDQCYIDDDAFIVAYTVMDEPIDTDLQKELEKIMDNLYIQKVPKPE